MDQPPARLPEASLPERPLALNARAALIARAMARDAGVLRIGVSRPGPGSLRLDCGHAAPGSTGAGLRLARAALGGLAEVDLHPAAPLPWAVSVRTAQPALAALGCQYAGWKLPGEGSAPPLYGSGPARLLARADALARGFPEDRATHAVLVVESAEAPPDPLGEELARACGVSPARAALLHAPTGSLAGMAQVAARALECALLKLRSLGQDPACVAEGAALCPVAPSHPDPVEAMGRANEAIACGAFAHLHVTLPDEEAQALAAALPASASPAWGPPLTQLLREAGGELGALDAGLLAPARVLVTALPSGRTFAAGRTHRARLRALLG